MSDDKGSGRDQPAIDAAVAKESPGFPIVGIGASAGGLDALKELFAAMPADSGMAFVIVQHLEPTHESRMAEILGKSTAMKVLQAEDGMAVEPNAVVTNPAGRTLSIRGGRLVLGKRTEGEHVETAIDHFLTSLAADRGARAVGIILSGSNGLDGPRGVRAVRAARGLCMAQEPGSAVFPAMPQAAIGTGLVDYVLAPRQMPAALMEFMRHPQVVAADRDQPPTEAASGDVETIVNLLRARTGSDYRHYKRTTVLRRIQHRMGLRQVGSMHDYIKLLQKDAEESACLAKDMLIGVSSFFRDTEAFEELRTGVIVPLVQARDDEAPLRAWVAGCATGEEAYSIAMLLLEARFAAGKTCPVQVFATDVDELSLEPARAGTYALDIAGDVSPERLERFFRLQGKIYHVDKHLREAVVFSRHNLLSDPPFSRLDLVSCRNVLIYLDPPAQKKVLSVLSFALTVGGHLLLGRSESVTALEDLFEPISKKNRIYRLARSNRRAAGVFPLHPSGPLPPETESRRLLPGSAANLRQANLETILRHFDATVVLIEPDGKILYLHGQTEKYLGHPKGLASLNILDMTSGTLSAKLRHAIDKAVQHEGEVSLPRVPLPREGAPLANLTVLHAPGHWDATPLLAVIFEDARPLPSRVAGAPGSVPADDEPLVARLEAEIKTLRSELRSNADGYDTANEELKAANEEVTSMNEELQSANEELEASKEELQSINEELSTVNNQLADKVNELTETNNDLANLMKSTEIATIFLDSELRIRRFTPRAMEMLNVIESDLGRPVSHITQKVTGIDLIAAAAGVLKSLSPLEDEVRTRDGRWYTVRVLPYRTLDNRIAGVVVTFSDVGRLKETENRLRYEKTYAQSVVETVQVPLIVLDDQLRVLSANAAFHRVFQTQPDDTVGKTFGDLGDRQWEIPSLRDVLRDVADDGLELEDFEVRHDFPAIGPRTMLLNARRIAGDDAAPRRVLLAIEDITDRKATEAELLRLTANLSRSNKDLEQFAYVVSHDLQEPLRMITGFVDIMRKELSPHLTKESREHFSFVVEGAQRMQAMIKDLLAFSRLGTATAERTMVDLAGSLEQALKNLRTRIDQNGARITHDPLPAVVGSPVQLASLFQNLVGNAIKFRRDEPPEIHIGASRGEKGWLISVRDNGIGIDPRFSDRIFQVFQRLSARETHEGTGIGLAVCKRIVEQHGGRIWLESEVGKGTTFSLILPAGPAVDEQDTRRDD